MNCRILSPVHREIVAAANWFDERRDGLGDEFWRLVDEVLADIQANPYRFAKSEYATEDSDIRFALVARFHYVIHFVIESDEVVIASVAHGARRPGYWLRRVRK